MVQIKFKHCFPSVLGLLFMLASGCASPTNKRTLSYPDQVATLDNESPYLKVHLKGGNVYLLSLWSVDEGNQMVRGTGDLLNADRSLLKSGHFDIPVDSVALFETNVLETSSAVKALAVVTGISVAVTAACLLNPKACFGSCPTFYVSDGDDMVLQAEGFSASIAPSLEARDVDALYRARPSGPDFKIRVTNEALETHVIRYVDLIAVKRPVGGRVFVDAAGVYREAGNLQEPIRCKGANDDCLAAVLSFDNSMRSSTTDGENLATREFIELEFANEASDKLGIVIGARQTFLSTYVFYQALAYMGRSASYYLAALERGDKELLEKAKGIHHLLGGIEIQILDAEGNWNTVGQYDETGPLATDVQLISLPTGAKHQRIRLKLTRGHWRIDYIALAHLGNVAKPLRLRPKQARPNEASSNDGTTALVRLLDPEKTLTTVPGDEYLLRYSLPPDVSKALQDYEFFIESRGYYLEWMREEWVSEENPLKAAMIFYQPAVAMRLLAPAFKKVEAEMEALFWKSRYARP